MQMKPFEELLKDIPNEDDIPLSSSENPHDPAGSVLSPFSKHRRPISLPNSGSPPPRPADDPPVPEDPTNPSHYRRHPSGIECIEVTRHMNFNTGNAVKYIWRYMDKGDPVENLKKAQWYLDDEIRRLQGLR
jgi:hypothetical protein